MAFGYFGRGFVLGFCIAAPLGPIGLLCLRRTLAEGPARGFVAGLGAATADALYGAVAGCGLTAVAGFLLGQRRWLELIGGLFLCWLGAQTLRSRPPEAEDAPPARGWLAAYGSTLALTLANPATILSFAALFAGLGLAGSPDYGAAGRLVAGVFSGSATWWLILAAVAGLLRERLSAAWTQAITRAAGGVLLGFGLWALARWVRG